jgi:hypothetical protein
MRRPFNGDQKADRNYLTFHFTDLNPVPSFMALCATDAPKEEMKRARWRRRRPSLMTPLPRTPRRR